ncbi:MAG: metal ABC transporter permease [Methanophagales archaeon]|nr:metal ABC transporter permease [Methanophagales archaeon]RLG31388.1 MAG: metal ABC transporter permease [Methanosarcinales archaeon]
MIEILQYEFMRNALIAALLASIACGIIGVYVVVKRIVFISGGIAHAAFGGIGLGYFLGVNPVLGVIPFSIAAALIMGVISKRTKIPEDTAIGILWVMGMALGVIFVALSPGYAPELFGYLFGSILTVPTSDIILMLSLNAAIIAVVFSLHREFQAISFDEEYATTIGLPTERLYLLLLCLIALTVVLLIRVVGVILVIALLTIPAAMSRQFTHRLSSMMFLSVFLCAVFTICGLWLSYAFDLPSGATIVLVSGTAFILYIIPFSLVSLPSE